MTSTLKKIDSATLEATVELGKEDLANSVAQAERNLAAMLTMDGFRQGKVPPEVARKHINEQQLREEALQIAVRQSLVDVAKKEKLDVMDQKDFVIKENTPEKLLYQVTLLLFPAVTLGNYKGLEVQKREELLDKIVASSSLDLPEPMVDGELEVMLAGFDSELHARGLELGPYLAHLKKTQDELKKEWRPQAETRAKIGLVLHAIGRAEKIQIGETELQEAVELRLQQFVAGNPQGAEELKNIDLERVKANLYHQLLNEKIFAFIESHATITSA